MSQLKQMKVQLWAMIAVGICVTVMAAVRQNTILAIIIFVAQGTMGSVLNAKYRNEVFRLIAEKTPVCTTICGLWMTSLPRRRNSGACPIPRRQQL